MNAVRQRLKEEGRRRVADRSERSRLMTDDLAQRISDLRRAASVVPGEREN